MVKRNVFAGRRQAEAMVRRPPAAVEKAGSARATEALAGLADSEQQRLRLRAILISLVVGTALLGVKYFAYWLTGSNAILSDAMESIVNVVAAAFALGGITFAGRPADRNHPYGHGKIEFFTAAFEGGLIAFAAVMIIYKAAESLWFGVQIGQLDLGLALTAGAGVVNLALGLYLIGVGQRHRSLALVADGRHVVSDFWTSVGVVVGLFVVKLTGLLWLDPVIAMIVGANLAWTGCRLVRHAGGGLLDEEDRDLLKELLKAMNAAVVPGIIRVHGLRAQRFGASTHVDAHLVVPEFWSVQRAHDTADAFERKVIATGDVEGEIAFHLDPCRRAYCRQCDLSDCPIRVEPFEAKPRLTVDEAVQTDEAILTSAH
jgi:cation diffusion facilitator family transporter